MPSRFCVVYITAPRGRVGDRIARALLTSRLAACVNIIPIVRSQYWWKGKIERGVESLLIVKTRRSLLKALEARVASIHPYSVPEVIALPIIRGNRPYLQWLDAETRKR